MGEIIKKFKRLPNGLDIELNEPQSFGDTRTIHIQNEKGRICLTESEFIELAMLFFSSKKKVESYKK